MSFHACMTFFIQKDIFKKHWLPLTSIVLPQNYRDISQSTPKGAHFNVLGQ